MSAKQTAVSFWKRVNTTPGCWEWMGARNTTGYGTVGWHGKTYVAHRIAAWLCGMVATPVAPTNPDDPTYVLHRCDNRKCCRPTHLFLGNYSDNQKDAYNKSRRAQPRGQHHANAKLTNEQAAEIRIAYAKGSTQMELAAQYSVSQVSISQLVRGKKYK